MTTLRAFGASSTSMKWMCNMLMYCTGTFRAVSVSHVLYPPSSFLLSISKLDVPKQFDAASSYLALHLLLKS